MGPASAAYIKRQNEKIENRQLDAIKLPLDTLGIVNGCIDDLIQSPGYIEMGTNNPYNITIFDAAAAQAVKDAFYGPGGAKEQMEECRRLATLQDPHGRGDVAAVNSACEKAFNNYYNTFLGKYYETQNGNIYDVAMPYQDIVLPYFYGYLLQKDVLDDLGVPVNFTASANAPYYAAVSTGDSTRAGRIADIEELLDSGVKVSMMYGDRDYICNCECLA
jgi:carboxypeptidase D